MNNNKYLDYNAWASIGWFYLYNRQYIKAEKYFKIAMEGWPPSAKSSLALHKSTFFFMLDSARGNYFSAIKYLQVNHLIKDSIFTEAKSKQIENLKIFYETEQKDKDIQILHKDKELQKNKLLQEKYTRNRILGGVVLLLVIVGLLLYNGKVKQRTNKKLWMQQESIAKQNDTLRHLVNEKEWLVKEIHHRVKNNFQSVMGLLGTQAGYLKNEVAVDAITDSQRRIQAMSLIHQKLYQSNNLSAINMPDYIHELVDFLSDSFNANNRIRFNLEIEPIELDLAHCIPLGLILNEAITNSFKYAFPDNTKGIIFISFKRSANEILLTIKDNGTGLPAVFDIEKSNSMGMNLMRGLSDEIGAQLTISSENGTHISVSFVYDPETTHGILSINTKQLLAT